MAGSLDAPVLLSSLTSEAWDLLSFRTLVSPALLLIAYYAGAVAIPVLVAWFIRRMRRRVATGLGAAVKGLGEPAEVLRQGIAGVREAVRESSLGERLVRTRLRVLLVAVGGFVTLELMWRMLFEFLLVYFQIRDLLMSVQGA